MYITDAELAIRKEDYHPEQSYIPEIPGMTSKTTQRTVIQLKAQRVARQIRFFALRARLDITHKSRRASCWEIGLNQLFAGLPS